MLRRVRQSSGGVDTHQAELLERARLAALAKVAKNPAKEFSNEKRAKREQEEFVRTVKQSAWISVAIVVIVVPLAFPRIRAHIYVYLLCVPVLLLLSTLVIATSMRAATLFRGPSSSHNKHNKLEGKSGEHKRGSDLGADAADAAAVREKEKQQVALFRNQLTKTGKTIAFAHLDQRFSAKYADLRRRWFNGSPPSIADDQTEFERIFSKHLIADYRLMRFLRVSAYDFAKAEQLALESMYCLTAFRLDDHANTYKIPLRSYIFPKGFYEWAATTEDRIGRWWLSDKEGRLGMFYRVGTFDFDAWYKAAVKQDALALLKSMVYSFSLYRNDSDYMHEASRGDVDSSVSLVVDIEGFKPSQLPSLPVIFDFGRVVLPFLSVAFPETSANLIVINAPNWVAWLFSVIKPLVWRVSRITIQIYGRCYVERHLHPYFHDEFIPKYLGGKLVGQVDNDPYCRDRLLFAGGFCITTREKQELLKAAASED